MKSCARTWSADASAPALTHPREPWCCRGCALGRACRWLGCCFALLAGTLSLAACGGEEEHLLGRAKAVQAQPPALPPVPVAAPPRAIPTSPLTGWAEAVGPQTGRRGLPARIRRRADGMEMVLIPAGSFQMGSVPGSERVDVDQLPRHEITITRPYYIDEHEVTVAMWVKYARAAQMPVEAQRTEAGLQHPVHRVSWSDIQGYLQWAQVSLPTEAQWERAARGGHDDYLHAWPGPDADARRNGEGKQDGFDGLAPVKAFAPNDYGLYDMIGNVAEWCADWYESGYYLRSPERDPLGPSAGNRRVARGGSWRNLFERHLRASHRSSYATDAREDHLGFRCVRTMP